MTDQQRAARLHYHIYETCEGIQEHAERIVALEELVQVAYQWQTTDFCGGCHLTDECTTLKICTFWVWFAEQMRELGIEVDR